MCLFFLPPHLPAAPLFFASRKQTFLATTQNLEKEPRQATSACITSPSGHYRAVIPKVGGHLPSLLNMAFFTRIVPAGGEKRGKRGVNCEKSSEM
jgi:hypothetical protein